MRIRGSHLQERFPPNVYCTKLSPAYAITNRHKNLGSLAQSDRVPADLQHESLIMDGKQEKPRARNSKKGKVFLVE